MASSIKDLLAMENSDFMRMSTKELKQAVQIMASAGNKRLVRFQRRGETTPATRAVYDSGGKFSTAGKNINQLRAEYSRVRSFLSSPTGTSAGWNKVVRNTIKSLKSNYNINITHDQFNSFWKLYDQLSEIDPTIKIAQFKYDVLRDISETMIDESGEINIDAMQERIRELYEQEQELRSRSVNVSGYFE